MATNQQLSEIMALDLGIEIKNRRPTAKEVFKWLDIDLLPHTSVDTLLCEIYEWTSRNWRSTNENLIGEIFNPSEIPKIKEALIKVPKRTANVPDFEFTKEDFIDIGLDIPSLFGISIKGKIENAKTISVKVNKVTKSRITNIDPPGIQILSQLSAFSQTNSKLYRQKIKRNYLIKSLFYAESVDIFFEKKAGANFDVSFSTNDINVETKIDTKNEKEIKLKYKGQMAPFAADLVKGKDFDF